MAASPGTSLDILTRLVGQDAVEVDLVLERGVVVGSPLNLEFGAAVSRDGVEFRYGDVTDTGIADGRLDAITCMSVIERVSTR